MGVYGPHVDEKARSPDAGDEFLPSERSAMFRGKGPQELKLFPAQPDLALVQLHLKADAIDAEPANLGDALPILSCHAYARRRRFEGNGGLPLPCRSREAEAGYDVCVKVR